MADFNAITRELVHLQNAGSYFVNGYGIDVAEDGRIIILNEEGVEIGFAWRDPDGRFHLQDLEGREWIYSQDGRPLGYEDIVAARSMRVREDHYAENSCDPEAQCCPDDNTQLQRSVTRLAETAPKIVEPKESRVSKAAAKENAEPIEKNETELRPAIYIIPEADPKPAAEGWQVVLAEQSQPLPLTPQPLQIAAVPEASAMLAFTSPPTAGHVEPVKGHGKGVTVNVSDNPSSTEIISGVVFCFNPAPQDEVSRPPSVHEENVISPQPPQSASAHAEPRGQLRDSPSRGLIAAGDSVGRRSRSNRNGHRSRARRGEIAESSPAARPRSKNNVRESTAVLTGGETSATANSVGAPVSPSYEARDAGVASGSVITQKRANRQTPMVDGRRRDLADDRGHQGRDQDEHPEEQDEIV